MRFVTRELTNEEFALIAGWRYAAPYDVYDGAIGWGKDGSYRAICDGDGVMWGFFGWGASGQVDQAAALYETDRDALDFCIGLDPKRVGMGHGVFAVHCALSWLRQAFHPAAFRLAAYAWNDRAQRIYRRLGFEPQAVCEPFVLMRLDERPWHNATRPLVNGITVFPTDPAFERRLVYHKENCGWDVSVISMSVHTGTHIDAPAHLGLPGDTESIPVSAMQGAAKLASYDTFDFASICAQRILLKDCPKGITVEQAQQLVSADALLVGIDGLSVGFGTEEREVHRQLLSNGVIVLENADIADFQPGWYEMRCLPLRLPGSDGAPVRLLLREVLE